MPANPPAVRYGCCSPDSIRLSKFQRLPQTYRRQVGVKRFRHALLAELLGRSDKSVTLQTGFEPATLALQCSSTGIRLCVLNDDKFIRDVSFATSFLMEGFEPSPPFTGDRSRGASTYVISKAFVKIHEAFAQAMATSFAKSRRDRTCLYDVPKRRRF